MANNKNNKIGIILAVNGEAEFKRALKDCKNEVNDYKDKLKKLNEKFKDGTATLDDYRQKQELLTQKQGAYQKTLTAAKEGLQNANTEMEKQKTNLGKLTDELKSAQDAQKRLADAGQENTEEYKKASDAVKHYNSEVETQAKKVEIAEKSVNTWNKEIDTAERNLRSCDKEVEDFAGDMEKAGKKTSGFTVSLKDMIKNKAVDMAGDALRALGEKAIEAAKYVIEVGSSFEAEMDKVAAISGASTGEVEKLAEKAKEMGRTTKFTASESAEAMEYMAMAGWKTDDMLKGLDGVMNLAAASGADLATTSDIVTDALTAFGEGAEESGRLADIMAAASTNANTNVEMMGETFKYVAPVAGALNYSMEDTAVAVGLMANSGIKASQAGTSLRSGLTRLVSPTKQAREAMEKYGISVTDTDGNMLSFHDLMVQLREKLGGLSEAEQTAAASAIFGKESMSGWLAIVNSSEEDFDKLTAAINNSEGAAQTMAGEMQDNLQGKIAIFNSAVEGLGIQLYNYFSGPLQSVVEFATGIISGITEKITPHKTVLETFIDDIKKANDQVQESIDHAKQTVADAETKVGEIEVYKDELTDILGKCEEFNLVTLETGEKAIVDSSGNIVASLEDVGTTAGSIEEILEQFAEDGFNTDGIEGSSTEAQDMIGYVETKVTSVEETLKNFAKDGIDTTKVKEGKEVIVQYFDEAGTEIESFEQDVKESGAVEIDTSGVDAGTTVMITAFNESTNSVETFRGTVEDLQNVDLNLSNLGTEFEKVESSVQTVYHITDEFTKLKINTMIENLGGAVGELEQAWNANTGELTANKEQLEDWFDTAKEVAMYKALESAVQELYTAWGNSAVNVAKANTAVKNAQQEFDEYVANTGLTLETVAMTAGPLADEYYRLSGNLSQAKKEQEEANAILEEANTELKTNAGALTELKDVVGQTTEATKENTQTQEEAQEALEGVTEGAEGAAEAEDDLAGSTEGVTEATAEQIAAWNDTIKAYEDLFKATDEYKQKQAELTDEELAEWCQAQIDSISDLKEEYDNLVSSLASGMESYIQTLDATDEEGNKSLDKMLENIRNHTAEVQLWRDQMLILASKIGGDFTQEMYDELVNQGFEKSKDTVALLCDSIDAETGQMNETGKAVAQEFARGANDTEIWANEVAQFSSQGRQLGEAGVKGFQDVSPSISDAVEETLNEGASAGQTAAEGYKEDVGEAAGEAAKEGIESKERVIEDASKTVVEAGKKAATDGAQAFAGAGRTAMFALEIGMSESKDRPIDKVKSIIDSAKSDNEEETKTQFEALGKLVADSMGTGITNNSTSVQNATRGVIIDGKNAGDAYQSQYETLGNSLAQAMANGISNNSYAVSGNTQNVMSNAANAAGGYNGHFENVGYNAMIGLANGIYNGGSYAIRAASDVAYDALCAAKRELDMRSPSHEFEKIGVMSDEGMAIGFEKSRGLVERSARDSARSAMRAAQDELTGGSLISQISYAGADQLNRIASARTETADTASALKSLTAGMEALTGLAESLSSPEAPNVTVMIGNEKFKGYIVRTATNGMSQIQDNIMKGVGA